MQTVLGEVLCPSGSRTVIQVMSLLSLSVTVLLYVQGESLCKKSTKASIF